MTERTVLLFPVVVLLVVNAGAGVAIASDEAPLADAGLDQSVERGALVYLDGGGSTAPDGRVVQYRWDVTAPDGTSVNVSDERTETASFRATQLGTYEVELTVWSETGASASDILYVDVAPSSENVENDLAPLEVEILGTDSVNRGESATYLAATSIDEERIESFEWSVGSRNETGPTFENTFDGSASSVLLEVTVTDEHGRSTTAQKNISVVEMTSRTSNPGESVSTATEPPTTVESTNATNEEVLEVTIAGDDAVVNDSTGTYRAVVTGAESEIVRYVWSHSGTGTVVSEDGRISEHYFGSPGQEELSVAVETENGTTEVGRKTIDIIEPTADSETQPQNNFTIDSIQIVGGDYCTVECEFQVSLSGLQQQDAIVQWQIGATRSGVTEIVNNTSTMSSILDISDIQITRDMPYPYVEVRATVTTQNGESKDIQRHFEVSDEAVRQSRMYNDGEIVTWESTPERKVTNSPIEITALIAPESQHELDFSLNSGEVIWDLGDGTQSTNSSDDIGSSTITHIYEEPGTYTIQFSFRVGGLGSSGPQISHITYYDIRVHQDEYTEYHYTVPEEGTATYESTTKPGPEWKQSDVVSSSLELTNVEREYVQQSPDAPTIDFGDGWERVDTETRYEQIGTETRTTHRDPGGDWSLAEENVDTALVQTGWESVTVGSHYLADDEWRYVGRTAETVERTQTTRSTSRPSGSGWTRTGRTGSRAITGYRTVTVGSQYLAHRNWDYLGATTRTTTRTETYEVCTSYANFFGYRTCVREETRTRRVTDRDVVYRYRRPIYGSVYEWERSVEQTVYQYEYDRPTYDRVSLDRYERPVYGDRTYDVWEKREYETTTVYEWTKTETVLVDRVSLTRPDPDDVVGDIEARTYSCDSDEGELADQAC